MRYIQPKALVPIALSCAFTLTSGASFAAAGYKDGSPLPTHYAQTIYAENEGVIANDGLDDAGELQAIIDSIPLSNSPNNLVRIVLPAGEIILADEVHVDRSGIIIEGQGTSEIDGTKVVIHSWQPYTVENNEPNFDKKYWPGFAAFRTETRIKHPNEQAYEGSINYHWKHSIEIVQPASIGDTVLTLESNKASKFSVGDLIYVGAANDDNFLLDEARIPDHRLSGGHIYVGHMRTQIFHVTGVNVDSDTVTIDAPLEFNIEPLNSTGYKSRVMPVTAVENVGFRNFTLTMDKNTTNCANYNRDNYTESNPMGVGLKYVNLCAESAIHGLLFKWANDSFVDNVKIDMVGSHPVVTEFAKNMTFQNIQIDGSWNKGKGGNGYFRGSKLYDSVIKNNTIENVRHLTLQWSATGNIVEGNYLNADMNLHGGWERNNVIRNNTIEVPFEHRSWKDDESGPDTGTWQPIWYGSAAHASKWSGPTGPNNMFINNTLKKETSPGAGITRWGLFDSADVAYSFGWDGAQFKHLNIGGVDITEWNQQTAEGVYAHMPETGVHIGGVVDPDSDGDGVPDSLDACPNTAAGTEVDAVGCPANLETDDDLDGVHNDVDQCPNTPEGTAVDEVGCAIIVDGDDDNDGVLNSVDQCPNTAAGVAVNSIGCPLIVDNDCTSITNISSSNKTEVTLTGAHSCIRFMHDLSLQTNQFWDSDANASCNFRGSVSSVDGNGSIVISGNYVSTSVFSGKTLKLTPSNNCPYILVRAYGDVEYVDGDDDNDGVLNSVDLCPNTSAGVSVDTQGCALVIDGDDDYDGVLNSVDQCPNTPANTAVDANGCTIVIDGDDDNDGVLNSVDQCPNTPANTDVDANGCTVIADNNCTSITDIVWSSKQEVVLSGNNSCIRFDRDLASEVNQFWDSDDNAQCDFRGTISSVDGSGTFTISNNYASTSSLSGTTLMLTASNGCSFIKVRAY